jgi:hypothetical protein
MVVRLSSAVENFRMPKRSPIVRGTMAFERGQSEIVQMKNRNLESNSFDLFFISIFVVKDTA